MKAKKTIISLCLLSFYFSTLGWSSTGHARTIYQYIDKDGAVAFSDSPPAHTNDFLLVDIPEPEPVASGEAEETLDEMIKVTEKLEAARREREQAREQEAAPPPATAYNPGYEDDGYGYFYPGYAWPYPHPRAKPPLRVDQPRNPAERRLEELKTPIRIPQFGSGEPLHQRLEPFNPPSGPPRRR